MTSPAERYAAFRRRQQAEASELARFRTRLGFELDDFQVQACEAVEAGHGVLVAAPTGAGKTVVGEFAVHLSLVTGRKAFYTTPIKALSNQKYLDLAAVHGRENVGLLTGDTSINGSAPIVVMTTEVLRNMLYAASPTLAGLGYVVMDEVHYLADRFRGPVWEEVIIHLDPAVQVVSLSATVSNAEEFGDWLTTVRGNTAVVVSEHRPVPLWQHMMVGSRLLDLYAAHVDPTAVRGDPPLSPELVEAVRRAQRTGSARGAAGRGGRGSAGRDRHGQGGRGQGRRGPDRHARDRRDRPGDGARFGPRVRPAPRPVVVDRLDRAGLLPAIVFIFSRAGCEAAVHQTVAAGVRLTTAAEAATIREVVEQATAAVPPEDLAVVGYDAWALALERGVAAHHAGLLPVFKETVEQLFTAGLIKVVYATETLALGINMPARSVVLESLTKWNGSAHVQLTPGEYTQLTGRAGRRGIDVEGHAVVLYSDEIDPVAVAGLASRRTYPLRSAFHPTYNMAVNLLATMPAARAREVLETSFAQFQADRGVVGLARQAARLAETVAEYERAMTCHLGDFTEYAELRRQIKAREADLSRERSHAQRATARRSMEGLRRGDVVSFARGRRSAHAVVLEAEAGGFDGPQLRLLTDERQVRTLTAVEAPGGVRVVGKVRVPKGFNPRNPAQRRDLASSLRNALAEGRLDAGGPGRGGREPSTATSDEELARLRERLRNHPCHGCADREEHARWAQRWERAKEEQEALLARIQRRTGTIADDFDKVCAVLLDLGYLAADDGGPGAGAGADGARGSGGGAGRGSGDGARGSTGARGIPGDGARAGALRVTEDGRWLARLYAEKDLLLAQCLRRGAWDTLSPAELAAVVSTTVYSARTETPSGAGPLPGGPHGRLGQALDATVALATELTELERQHRVTPMEPVDLGLVAAVHTWAQGAPLADALLVADLGAGDFVRWCKQVLDVLDQVSVAAPQARLAQRAREAMGLVRRGVVAWSTV
ncbi:DEAD/DEAH box helicase [Georgenia sp. TF02-10]|uniref:DEAD/DEAH box helicase n=1 Tax=Georgenia sp. TF02-10 TaxID=2917725 RepID=UPI001FA6DF79|nr:DEAD/DEAH box helicase [Georgenia sp. TF02-10]UNX53190.1 DEAD/DEAH box helicase [Georgenia sp. TF02-10]